MMMPVVHSVRPPGPAGSYLWSIRRALKDPLTLLLDVASYGDVVTLRRNKTFLITSVLWRRQRRAIQPAFCRAHHFPFGAGPRLCVGAQFAMREVPLVAAMRWRRFVNGLVAGPGARPFARISLTADRPMRVRLAERQG